MRLMSIESTTLTLELTVPEAEAVKSWMLKPCTDGSAAIDDSDAQSAMMKLGAQLDYLHGVARVREELENAGFPTATLSDEQVANLGRRIAESPIRRYPANGF
jgi:hypothetical protein